MVGPGAAVNARFIEIAPPCRRAQSTVPFVDPLPDRRLDGAKLDTGNQVDLCVPEVVPSGHSSDAVMHGQVGRNDGDRMPSALCQSVGHANRRMFDATSEQAVTAMPLALHTKNSVS